MNWIETKEAFHTLSRLGVQSVKMPATKYYKLEDLIRKNVDDGGSHFVPARYDRLYLSFFGIKIEVYEDDV